MKENALRSQMELQGGRYTILKVLGQGGFGITYLAEQKLLQKQFAIKEFFLQDLCARDRTGFVTTLTQADMVDRYRRKFYKEAQILASLNHPNIVRVTDIFEENDTVYYVMEFVEGESLAEMVSRKGALPEPVALRYISRVADALDYIHHSKVNHLDLKPANIMVRRADDEPVVIDFGVSKQYDEQKNQTTSTPPGVSNGYSPLEQYKPGGVSTFSPQADIYSLGATLYKLLTGNTPPIATDIVDDGLPPMPSTISPRVCAAIEKAMQPRRRDRPGSIKELMRMIGPIDVVASQAVSSHEEKENDDGTLVVDAEDVTEEAPRKDEVVVEHSRKETVESHQEGIAESHQEETEVHSVDESEEPRRSGPRDSGKQETGGKKEKKEEDETVLTGSSHASDNISARPKEEEVREETPIKESVRSAPQVKEDESAERSRGKNVEIPQEEEVNSSVVDLEEHTSILSRLIKPLIVLLIVGLPIYLYYKSPDNEEVPVETVFEIEWVTTVEADSVRNAVTVEELCPDSNHPHAIDLGLPSGTKWACCNVDAGNPKDYGGYYAWGETETKSTYDCKSYSHCDGTEETCQDLGSDISGTEYDVAHVKWGGLWRIPTNDQNEELINNCTFGWTTVNGVKGVLFTSKKNGRNIFMPATGYREGSIVNGSKSHGGFWSSTQDTTDWDSSDYCSCALGLSFWSDGASTDSHMIRYYGNPVRPVSN